MKPIPVTNPSGHWVAPKPAAEDAAPLSWSWLWGGRESDKDRPWAASNFAWMLISALAHTILVVSLALIPLATRHYERELALQGQFLDTSQSDEVPLVELGNVSLEPSELSAELLTVQPMAQTAQYNDTSPEFVERGGGLPAESDVTPLGGLGSFSIHDSHAVGPAVEGPGGVGDSQGMSNEAGFGGSGRGFGERGKGSRLAQEGGTQQSERAVAAALNWLHRHQETHGNWRLRHTGRCKGGTCTGVGAANSDTAATAMALLPFLGAGQTHKSKGPYQNTINKGIYWLIKQQYHDGNLAAKSDQPMYAHGLATITLCEAYGMSGDERVGAAAQKAVRFIEMAQNKTTGGWRYMPGEPGDTSVLGWQLMALKSAQMAGLAVDSSCFAGAEKWLKSVAHGRYMGLYGYLPYRDATPSMTSVGMLCRQYMGAQREDMALGEGREYMLTHLPDLGRRDTYYWYYATQVMHNFSGPDWDTWNRRMRRILIETQAKDGCATGSWDPASPTEDAWGGQGGRLMLTSLSALTLEVYYRYLPLYKLDRTNLAAAPAGPEAETPSE